MSYAFTSWLTGAFDLDTMGNLLMDLSRESQMSMNTSEVEESVEVRETCNRSFLLSIRYFAFIISFLHLLHYLNLGTNPISLQERLLDP